MSGSNDNKKELIKEVPAVDLRDPGLYINRELSMLAFQRRVLEEACDEANPLLERIFFLSIVGSNLDEFFMVRVGGLKMQNDAGIVDFSIDGLTPAEQLAVIRKDVLNLMENAQKCLYEKLIPLLNEDGIIILNYQELTDKQRENIDDYFQEIIFPVLTPLAFDPGHPFPHISNLSLNLAVVIEDPDGFQHFARVKVPASLPRLVPIKRSSGSVKKDGTVPHKHYFVWIDEVIQANLQTLFPGMKVVEAHPFRVTRNADMVIQELEAGDLLETMEESVRKRRFGAVVRLTINEDMPNHILDILISNLEVDSKDIYKLNGVLGLSSLMQLHRIDRYDLKFKPFIPATPASLRFGASAENDTIFNSIQRGEILLHHPYESFLPVVEFIKRSARDSGVLAIKQTLYRVGTNSPVVKSLLEARRDYGKQVAVLVELKARFDEESNIGWAKLLEREGVHITYGLLGLKTHSKVILVVRKEGEHIRRYIHLGTGNYNHITAQAYEDMGLFTCDEEIGADATDLFNYLTGYSNKNDYRKLLVAPINMRERFEEMIKQEIALHEKEGGGYLIFKMNSLVDKPMIRLLYKASQAGVKIDLLVRGICCLRPGVEGVSENIRVISIVGRFLEHSRIYYFRHGGEEIVYMGSADLMPRNLNQRVEVLFPVEDPKNIRHIRDIILGKYLADNEKGRRMLPDGDYERNQRSEEEDLVEAQADLLQEYQRISETL
jgi:polyphosphate kinase